MSCKLHHIRFYEPNVGAAHCIALHPDGNRLALSRNDASIEIWDLKGAPVAARVIPATLNGSIEAVCWVRDRLLTTGLGGAIVEWNLKTLAPQTSIPVTGHAAWCMDVTKKSTKLAVGTEQGYINIYSVEGETIDYERIFDKQEGRILCCKFDPSGEFLATGSIETIRIWNVSSGQALHRMITGRSEKKKETIVWSLAFTSDLTVVSGDSRGNLTFWDARIGEQIESINTHKADVLSICLSDDENTLWCAGVDPLIISFTKVKMKHKGDKMIIEKWVKNIQRNIHQHDVRAMININDKLYSCGIDGYLAMSSFPPKVLVKYPSIQSQTPVKFSHSEKIICLKYTNCIEIWQLGTASENQKGRPHYSLESDSDPLDKSLNNTLEMNGERETDTADTVENSTGRRLLLSDGPKLLLRLSGPSKNPIVCYDISSNHKWIAYSTEIHLRIFKFSMIDNSPTLSRLMPLPDDCVPCYRMCFAPNSNNLITGTADAKIKIIHIHADGAVTVGCEIETDKILTNSALTHLVSSKICDSKYYIAASDDASNIGVWEIKSDDDYSKPKFITHLPRYKYPPSAINFNTKENNILVAYTDQKLVEYNLKNLHFTKWSESLNNPETLGSKWWSRMFPITGLEIHPKLPHVLMAHDDCGIYVINKNMEIDDVPQSKKMKKNAAAKEIKLPYVVKKYKHLIGASWISSEKDEIEAGVVIVEPTSLLEKLPPAFFKKSFGCM